VEEPVIRRAQQAHLCGPPCRQHRRTGHLEQQGQLEDRDGKADQAVLGLHVQRLLQRQPLLHGKLSSQGDGYDRRDRHVPQSAGLDEDQHDQLTEQRQIRRGVDHDETCHADRRRGREQRIEQRQPAAG
jgi:hypothetical protein